MKKSWRQYRIWDVKTGRYFYADHTSKEMVENQIRNRGKAPPEYRHRILALGLTYYERVTVIKKKPMDCAACGKSSDCAKTSGLGVRHSEVWICERCWETETRQRRSYNTKHILFRGDPDRLVIRSWPKDDKIIETWQYRP